MEDQELRAMVKAFKRRANRTTWISYLLSAVLLVIAGFWLYGTIRAVQEAEHTAATAENLLEGVSQSVAKNPTLKDAIELSVKSVDNNLSVVSPPAAQQGYLVILGSFKSFADADRKAKSLRQKISQPVGIYYAVNDYYAPAIGIIPSKEAAVSIKNQAAKVVPDAYIFPSVAFPYEIKSSPH